MSILLDPLAWLHVWSMWKQPYWLGWSLHHTNTTNQGDNMKSKHRPLPPNQTRKNKQLVVVVVDVLGPERWPIQIKTQFVTCTHSQTACQLHTLPGGSSDAMDLFFIENVSLFKILGTFWAGNPQRILWCFSFLAFFQLAKTNVTFEFFFPLFELVFRKWLNLDCLFPKTFKRMREKQWTLELMNRNIWTVFQLPSITNALLSDSMWSHSGRTIHSELKWSFPCFLATMFLLHCQSNNQFQMGTYTLFWIIVVKAIVSAYGKKSKHFFIRLKVQKSSLFWSGKKIPRFFASSLCLNNSIWSHQRETCSHSSIQPRLF